MDPHAESLRAGPGRLIALVLIAQTCALFFRSWLEIELDTRGVGNSNQLSYLIVPLLLLVLLSPALMPYRAVILDRFQLKQLTWRVVSAAVLLGVLLRISYWCALIVSGVAGLPATDARLIEPPLLGFECPDVSVLLSLIIVLAIMTPIVEEAINRGLILHWLLANGRWQAIVVSAILFAIFHVPEGIPFAFGFGLFAAVYVLNSGHLWGATIAHGTYNGLIALDWLCFQIVWRPSSQSSALILVAATALAIGIAAITACGRIVSKRTTAG